MEIESDKIVSAVRYSSRLITCITRGSDSTLNSILTVVPSQYNPQFPFDNLHQLLLQLKNWQRWN